MACTRSGSSGMRDPSALPLSMRDPRTDLSKKKPMMPGSAFDDVAQPNLGVVPFLANPVDCQPQRIGHHLVAQAAEMMHFHAFRSHAMLGREPRQRVVQRK